jgi:uncharacterized protein YbjT (DUF2867 family)
LLAETNVDLVISGRHLDKAQAYADELYDPRVTVKQVDASNFESLRAAFQGIDFCLVA